MLTKGNLRAKLLEHGASALTLQERVGIFGDVNALVASGDLTNRSALNLVDLVPARHQLWQTLRALQLETAESMMVEQAFMRGYRPLRTLVPDAAVEIAIAKSSLARMCPHLLAALDPEFDPTPYDTMVSHMCVALQALSDLRTWPADLAARRPSLVIAGCGVDELPREPEAMKQLKRALVARGHLRAVTDLAADHVSRAKRISDGAQGPRLVAYLAEIGAQLDSIRGLLPS